MNKKTKKVLDERVEQIKRLNTPAKMSAWVILNQFLEHPSKPGYKRKDIKYVLEQIAGDKM